MPLAALGLSFFRILLPGHPAAGDPHRRAAAHQPAIAITKGTALGTAVSLPELLGRAQSAMAIAANPSPLTLAAALYLLFFLPLVVASRWLEAPPGRAGTDMEALQAPPRQFRRLGLPSSASGRFCRRACGSPLLLAVVALPIAVAGRAADRHALQLPHEGR